MSKKIPMMGFWDLLGLSEVLEKLVNSLYHRDMHTQEQTTERERILAFWKAHGLTATKDARVSRPTLYRWQAHPVSTFKSHTRGYPKLKIPPFLADEIVRIRTIHPGLGKENLTHLLKAFCVTRTLPEPSEPTVGRMLQQLKAEGILKAPVSLRLDVKSGKLMERKPRETVKKLRRSCYLPNQPGDLLQIYGFLKINYGTCRYVFTAVDLVTRITWSKAYSSASSRNGKDFLTSILAD